MTTDKFRLEIERRMSEAKKVGAQFVEITSGDVHRQVGGYPSNNHRMPVCCGVMRRLMKATDEILPGGPEKGNGASLTIRYYL